MSDGRGIDPKDPDNARRFILENTKPLAPPLVPEIVLRLAEESLRIWQKTEDELHEMNLPPPFWAFAWAGGQAVARYLLDNPEICRGRSVLDLGSGSGLSAIAAAKAGASRVCSSDIDAFACAAVEINARANGAAIDITRDDLLGTEPRGDDIVVIGDLFYERPLAERVIAYIDDAKDRGSTVLIGDPQRSYFPRQRFLQLAEYRVPVSRELEDAEIKLTAVWRA